MVSHQFQDKVPALSMACRALEDLALLASSALCIPTLAQMLLSGHSALLTLPDVHLSAFERAACHMESPSPSPPHMSPLLTPLCTFILSFLSRFLLNWVRCFSLWSYSIQWIPILSHLLYCIVIIENLSVLLECELLGSRAISSSSLYPQSFAQCLTHSRFSINDY